MKQIKGIIIGLLIGGIAVFAGLQMMPKSEAAPINLTTDVQGTINDIGQLATAEFVYEITQVSEKPAKEMFKIKVPFTSGRVVYSYAGTIKAGIEFGDVKVKVDDEARTITVTMPEVILISNELDNDSFRVYDEKNSIFNPFTFEDFNLSQDALKQAAETAADSRGLREEALANARTIITGSIGSLYDLNAYSIIFQP